MIRFEAFERLGVAVAAFSDLSDGDCGLRNGPDAEGAPDRREAFCGRCGVDAGGLVCPQQVHETRVAWVREKDRGKGAQAWEDGLPETDGLLTDVPGLPLGICVADCAPVYLFDAQRRIVGLVHAGRQGTRGNICGHAIEALRARYGTAGDAIHALIGPSAGPCCYEVSAEMAEDLRRAGLPTSGRKLDLWEANVRQLETEGVPRSHITVTGQCTICDGRFHSHRARPDGARNLAVIML